MTGWLRGNVGLIPAPIKALCHPQNVIGQNFYCIGVACIALKRVQTRNFFPLGNTTEAGQYVEQAPSSEQQQHEISNLQSWIFKYGDG